MRISRIEVKGLFDQYDYDIPLHLTDRVTFIYGENGCGKTTVLKMISDFFALRFGQLSRTPFGRLAVLMDDDSRFVVTRKAADATRRGDDGGRSSLEIQYFKSGDEVLDVKTAGIPAGSREHTLLAEELVQENHRFLRTGFQQWMDRETHETIDAAEVLERYGGQVPALWRATRKGASQTKGLSELKELLHSVPCKLIQTQRLMAEVPTRRRALEGGANDRASQEFAVDTDAAELRSSIQEALATYASTSQEMDRSFPVRLLAASTGRAPAKKTLGSQLAQLESQRIRLMRNGLLDESGVVEPGQLLGTGMTDQQRRVLSIYIEDTRQKLEVLQDMAKRLDLFASSINARFKGKEVRISRDRGFSVVNERQETLSPSQLSSGEQHEVVLFYELLFKVQPGTLVMIDEPELSLHVDWQNRFIGDISQVARMQELDVLAATHSPDIIGDRWDLAVRLVETDDAGIPNRN